MSTTVNLMENSATSNNNEVKAQKEKTSAKKGDTITKTTKRIIDNSGVSEKTKTEFKTMSQLSIFSNINKKGGRTSTLYNFDNSKEIEKLFELNYSIRTTSGKKDFRRMLRNKICKLATEIVKNAKNFETTKQTATIVKEFDYIYSICFTKQDYHVSSICEIGNKNQGDVELLTEMLTYIKKWKGIK